MADQQKKQHEAQKKPALSDYERSLVKSSQPRKRVGKEVPQLGEVSKLVPPLIVPNQYGSNEDLMPKKSLAVSELDSLERYFGQSGLNMKEIAAIIGCQTFKKAEVKQFFDKFKEERKKRLNPEKPYFYVKPEELRKKVADQQKKQREAQKKPALSDYEQSLVKSSQPRKESRKGGPTARRSIKTGAPFDCTKSIQLK